VIALPLALLAPWSESREQQTKEHRPYDEWLVYQGDHGSTHYSELDRMSKDNVHQLQVAWVYHTRDGGEDGRTEIQCNPIVVDGVLYATSPRLKVFAVNAATGEEIWRFDPFAEEKTHLQGQSRGVAYWEDGEDKRILFTAGPRLLSLNAKIGTLDSAFGNNGVVRLDEGLDRDPDGLQVKATTPGTIYKNLIILGSSVSESPGAAPGHIRAFDVRTGERAWIFRTIPYPGEFGYETWPKDAWNRIGGANSWSGITLDKERGMIFVPTGSPAFDFYGGDRWGENLFGNCLIALNAQTGQRIWHFQIVHHDLWDRDLPSTPNLVTATHNGKRIDAVAQITKSGHVFLFDRDSGVPLFPIEERRVPPSDLRGEQAWPTQPFPVKPRPFARQEFAEEDASDISPMSRAYVVDRLKQVRSGGQFVPPSLEGTLVFPGFDGGGQWGGAAFDPATSILYVNSSEMPWIHTMVDLESGRNSAVSSLGRNTYMVHCASCHGVDRTGDGKNRYPPLINLEARYSQSAVFEVMQSGKGEMPAFPTISDEKKKALVEYLFDSDVQHQSRFETRSVVDKPLPEIPYSFTGFHRFLDPDGYPAVKPPWGTLNAVNLNTGEIEWQVPLGEFPELTARGIPRTGTENYGGPVVTAGGLIFIGATKDEKFRAFDKKTGKILWETRLPAGGYATPCTYEVEGRQYVVIAAGGGKMGTKSGDAYVAFALPE